MRVLLAAAMIALLAGQAFAQAPGQNPKSRQEIESERAAERAYKNSLGNIPDKAPADPWGIARTPDVSKNDTKTDAKAGAKASTKTAPAKPATKTGSTAN